ncbi:MAG: hypothetical protein JRZ94_05365 [Nitrososphaerota archaeon]|nr:hypothetical protein [Nitrososphaerota archaeon]
MAAKNKGFAVHTAISKYGFDNVNKKILARGKLDYILELEIKAINKFNTLCPHGYNIAIGGEGGAPKTLAVRDKISKSKLKHWQNPKYRANIIAINTGRTMTPEQNKKNSDSKKLAWKNPEWRENQIIKRIGKKDSEETKNKKSHSLKLAYAEGRRKGISDKMIGRRWINDGTQHKQILPDELIPIGWTQGMLTRKNK